MAQRTTYLGTLTDSGRWDHITLRADDVIVATPPKSGTTWMQTIVALLLSGDPEVETNLSQSAPWIDIRVRDIAEVAERLEAMTTRRSLKSHTPLDGLPVGAEAQYLCVFRHPLDVHMSFRNHVRNIPLDVFDPWYSEDSTQTFDHFLTGGASDAQCDAVPLAHILRHYTAARALSDRPNVHLFHYADMCRDLAGTFARVASLLDVSHPAPMMARLVQAASFDNMRQNADRFAPGGGAGFFKSDAGFFNRGAHGQWQGVLTDTQIAAYDAAMQAALSPQDRAWLEHGSAA